MNFPRRTLLAALAAGLLLPASLSAQQKRKIIIDEDAAGPATTDSQAILALIQSPRTDVLGVTVVTGDQWRDEEVAHALRLLEIIGRTDIPVVPGAVFPLRNSAKFIAAWEKRYGPVVYQGAWNWPPGKTHAPDVIPPLPEGAPRTKPSREDAAHFLVRMVHRYPHQVTIYAGGPLTDLAQAIALDPHFPELAKQLVVMGGSISPQTTDPEFRAHPHREFNFWMDPEAAHAVLTAPWPLIVDTPVDISIKTRLTKQMIAAIAKSHAPAAQYIAKYADPEYMWDELAAIAWLDPSIITRTEISCLDVSTDPGPTYGDTIPWPPAANVLNLATSDAKNPGSRAAFVCSQGPSAGRTSASGRRSAASPALTVRPVIVNLDLNSAKFYRAFISLLSRPTPRAKP